MSVGALIVDDSRFMRVIIREQVACLCKPVWEAGDAETALVLARQHRPGLITMDLSIDKQESVQGLAVIRELVAEYACCILVVSALDQGWLYREVMAAGAHDYLVKPFEGAELFRRLQALMEMAQ
jgi:two-component system, chemotaxis family, chemotaxis protein CheY